MLAPFFVGMVSELWHSLRTIYALLNLPSFLAYASYSSAVEASKWSRNGLLGVDDRRELRGIPWELGVQLCFFWLRISVPIPPSSQQCSDFACDAEAWNVGATVARGLNGLGVSEGLAT